MSSYPPFLGPVVALLKSRKFWVSVATLATNIIVAQVPALADVQTELVAVITAVGVVLIGSIAHEDAAAKSAS